MKDPLQVPSGSPTRRKVSTCFVHLCDFYIYLVVLSGAVILSVWTVVDLGHHEVVNNTDDSENLIEKGQTKDSSESGVR